MLDWLKKITDYKPAPRKLTSIEARLSAPNGSRDLYGDIEFDTYEAGDWKLDIEIEHPKGAPEGVFDIRFDGVSVASLTPDRGFDTEKKFRSEHFELAKHPMIGTKVEVYAAASLLLTGTFIDDM